MNNSIHPKSPCYEHKEADTQQITHKFTKNEGTKEPYSFNIQNEKNEETKTKQSELNFKNENIYGLIFSSLRYKDLLSKNRHHSLFLTGSARQHYSARITNRIWQLHVCLDISSKEEHMKDHPYHKLLASIQRLDPDLRAESLRAAAGRCNALPADQWEKVFNQILDIFHTLPSEHRAATLHDLRLWFHLYRGQRLTSLCMPVPPILKGAGHAHLDTIDGLVAAIESTPTSDQKNYLFILNGWLNGTAEIDDYSFVSKILQTIKPLPQKDGAAVLFNLIGNFSRMTTVSTEIIDLIQASVFSRSEYHKVLLPQLTKLLPKSPIMDREKYFLDILKTSEYLTDHREASLRDLAKNLRWLPKEKFDGAFEQVLDAVDKLSEKCKVGPLKELIDRFGDLSEKSHEKTFKRLVEMAASISYDDRQIVVPELLNCLGYMSTNTRHTVSALAKELSTPHRIGPESMPET